jgi:hypothetical protein
LETKSRVPFKVKVKSINQSISSCYSTQQQQQQQQQQGATCRSARCLCFVFD